MIRNEAEYKEAVKRIEHETKLVAQQRKTLKAAGVNPRAQIPQLIKLYLELGVRFLAFNKDAEFNIIDGLIWLDVSKIPGEIIERYMGKEEWAVYKYHHT